MVTVSAPGKVHLMGEHAVVYGYPAFLAAINKRLTVSVRPQSRGVTIDTPAEAYIRHIIGLIQRDYALATIPGMHITVSSEFPFGYHLGSSAALAAATIGAVMYVLKKVWNPMAINKLAYEAEKYAHGTPSGADNTVVTFGGLVWYRRELPFLKSIWQLPMKIPSSLNKFSLIDTGKPEETTKDMVEYVGMKMKSEKLKMKNLMNDNEEQARRIAVAIHDENEQDLIDAMKKGERTLEGMGVVSESVKRKIQQIEKSGGAAKILGGGGRTGGTGYLLAYGSSSPGERIMLGEEGIRLEEKS